jgi:hypothetical protein
LVFPEVDVVPEVVDGIVNVAQANGMAGMASNTVLLGWPESEDLRSDFLSVMRRLEPLNKSLVLARVKPRHLLPREDRSIHVWWGGLERNSDLMLLLAHLLHSNSEWRDATVHIMSIASSELMKTRTEHYLASLMPEIRIEAEVRVVLKPEDATVAEVIHRESADADVVFLGLQVPGAGEEAEYSRRLESLAGDLPVVFFVKNSSVFIGQLLETPETAETEETVADGPTRPPADPLPLPE